MNKAVFKNIFNYDSEVHNNERDCELLGVIANPSDNSIIDAINMPQFKIRFLDNDETYTAYPEEIDESDWLPEMKTCIEGMWCENKEKVAEPGDQLLAQYWSWGVEIALVKNN